MISAWFINAASTAASIFNDSINGQLFLFVGEQLNFTRPKIVIRMKLAEWFPINQI